MQMTKNFESTKNCIDSYLSAKAYPIRCTEAEKAVIRKRAKKFELVGGVLHYKDERNGESILR